MSINQPQDPLIEVGVKLTPADYKAVEDYENGNRAMVIAFARHRITAERDALERATKLAGDWASKVLSGDEPALFRDGARWASLHIATTISRAIGGETDT